MRTQRELDILKEEQRQRLKNLKESIIKEYLGDRYRLMPPAPGVAQPEQQPPSEQPPPSGQQGY